MKSNGAGGHPGARQAMFDRLEWVATQRCSSCALEPLSCWMNEHELGFTSFLAEPSKRRLRTLLELGPKRRKDVRALLDHDVKLDPRHALPLERSSASATSVEEVLRKHGAPPTCYVISADAALDGREMPLRNAVEAISGSFFGGFISCVPGKLGYFEYDNRKSAHLLRK